MTSKTRAFSDLNLSFLRNPTSDDVSKKYDEYAIMQSLRNIVLTRNYERPFNSGFGTQISDLLFEPASPLLEATLKKTIFNAIKLYEPRVNILDIIVRFNVDNNYVDISIVFTIINTITPLNLDISLTRTR